MTWAADRTARSNPSLLVSWARIQQLAEGQAQPVAHAWYNLLTKVGLFGEAHPRLDVRGILIFLDARDDPGLPRGIATASNAQLDAWLDGLLDAGSITDLIGPAGGPAS
jgi:hypothetical protein